MGVASVLTACSPPSAQLPAEHPSAKADYEAAVKEWMHEGKPIATGQGWASYRYWAHSMPDVTKLQSDVQDGFRRLCEDAGATVQPRQCSVCPGELRVCVSDRNLFGVATEWEEGRPGGGYHVVHYSGSQLDGLFAEEAGAQAFDNQAAAAATERREARAAEASRHKQRMQQRTADLRANLKTGDRGMIKNRSVEYNRYHEEFLVVEVKRPLAHIQLFNPQETVWIEIEKLRAFGDGCDPGRNIC